MGVDWGLVGSTTVDSYDTEAVLMGPYCDHCDQRCFVRRILKDGRSMLLATCRGGMARDYELLGEDHRSAINPVSGRPGYDTVDYRRLAHEIADLARGLASGEVTVEMLDRVPGGRNSSVIAGRLVRAVEELSRQTPPAVDRG